MEAVYIHFQMPKSSTGTEKENFLNRFFKKFSYDLSTKIFPVANPDFEEKLHDVEYWLIECDKKSGIPKREIGLNKDARVIMKMPLNDNYGYWTGNNLLLADFWHYFKVSEISKEDFEKHWNLFDKMTEFETQLEDFKVLSTGVDGGH